MLIWGYTSVAIIEDILRLDTRNHPSHAMERITWKDPCWNLFSQKFEAHQRKTLIWVILVDPHLFGGSYTWREGENSRCASRIGRFLYLLVVAVGLNVSTDQPKCIPKFGKDPNPIMLSCGDWNFKKIYFQFENGGLMWGVSGVRCRNGGLL